MPLYSPKCTQMHAHIVCQLCTHVSTKSYISVHIKKLNHCPTTFTRTPLYHNRQHQQHIPDSTGALMHSSPSIPCLHFNTPSLSSRASLQTSTFTKPHPDSPRLWTAFRLSCACIQLILTQPNFPFLRWVLLQNGKDSKNSSGSNCKHKISLEAGLINPSGPVPGTA